MKKFLNNYLKNEKILICFFVAEGIAFSLASVFSVLTFQWIVDYADIGLIDKLTMSVIICVGLYVIAYGLYLLDSYIFQKIIKNITEKIKRDTYLCICQLTTEEYGEQSSSYYQNIFQNDIPVMISSYYENILLLISQFSGLVLSMVFVFLINWMIGMIVVVIAILAAFVPRIFEKKLESLVKKNLERSEKYLNKLQNLLGAFELIKIYNLFDRTSEMHQREVKSLTDETFKLKIQEIKIGWVASVFTILAYMSVFIVGAYFVAFDLITIGAVIALSQMIGSVMSPIEQIPSTITSIRTSKPACERVYKLLNQKNYKRTIICDEEITKIELKNVNYCYNESVDPSLENISFTFLKGKRYLILGASGSGKSTLTKLLIGLLKPTEGHIYINAKHLDNTNDVVYKNISYMNQNPFVFESSIRENITLFGEYDKNAFDKAIKFAKIDKFISGLAFQDETNIGEQGSKISGGEKQRICIARTKYHSSDVVILDEFTANLDVETTSSIFNDLSMDKNTCYIVVMHNITKSIVSLFDEVLFLKNGKIQEFGNVPDLLEKQNSFLKTLLDTIE